MIVPGSASFPAIASLGRRLLPALSVVRCTVCVAPDSDHDPDRAFFFLLFTFFHFWLSFPFRSLLNVRSSPLPFRPLA